MALPIRESRCEQTMLVEGYGSTSHRNTYILSPSPHGRGYDVVKALGRRKFRSVEQFFRSAFLPQGFPESVSEDYLQYQIWDTVQAFSSGITGSLATQAVLKGVGVGDEKATVLAATITWLMKDGVSMLGRILFAWMQSSYLDSDCKRWRLFADGINDVAILLDIVASHFTLYFRPIVCVSGLCRSIVGVAGGATRAALTQHQARRNNMADVSAKDGSQETLVNLAALVCSMLLIPVVSDNQGLVWVLFILFTGLHLFANYSAVTSVRMETFNQARLHLVVASSLAGAARPSPFAQPGLLLRGVDDDSHGGHVMSVQQANQLEPVLWKTRWSLTINVGCSLEKLITLQTSLSTILSIFRSSAYMLSVDLQRGAVNIVLHVDAEYVDQLQACYHAELLDHCHRLATARNSVDSTRKLEDSHLGSIVSGFKSYDIQSVLSESFKYVQSHWSVFVRDIELVGWRTAPVQLCADEWRAEWSHGREEERKTSDDKKAF